MTKNKKRVVRELVGIVTSDKMQKTFVVKVTRKTTHPIFKKIINQLKKTKSNFSIQDIIKNVQKDTRSEQHVRDAVVQENDRYVSCQKLLDELPV